MEFVNFLNKKRTTIEKKVSKEKQTTNVLAKESKEPKAFVNIKKEEERNNNSLKNLLSKLEGKTFAKESINASYHVVQPEEIKINDISDVNETAFLAKQYYKNLKKAGVDKEMPERMKHMISKKEKEEEIKTINDNAKTVIYQIKRFEKETTKESIHDFFEKILSEENLIKIKRVKEDKVFNGLILIEIKNTPEANKLLLDKKIYFDKKKLKIIKYEYIKQ